MCPEGVFEPLADKPHLLPGNFQITLIKIFSNTENNSVKGGLCRISICLFQVLVSLPRSMLSFLLLSREQISWHQYKYRIKR